MYSRNELFSHGQFKYCPGQKIFCLGRRTRHTAKKSFSAIHKSLKMTSFVQKLTVSSGRVIFLDLYVAEMNFLAMDKIFCLRQKIFVPDKLNFVLDKIYFVWADGIGISIDFDCKHLLSRCFVLHRFSFDQFSSKILFQIPRLFVLPSRYP